MYYDDAHDYSGGFAAGLYGGGGNAAAPVRAIKAEDREYTFNITDHSRFRSEPKTVLKAMGKERFQDLLSKYAKKHAKKTDVKTMKLLHGDQVVRHHTAIKDLKNEGGGVYVGNISIALSVSYKGPWDAPGASRKRASAGGGAADDEEEEDAEDYVDGDGGGDDDDDSEASVDPEAGQRAREEARAASTLRKPRVEFHVSEPATSKTKTVDYKPKLYKVRIFLCQEVDVLRMTLAGMVKAANNMPGVIDHKTITLQDPAAAVKASKAKGPGPAAAGKGKAAKAKAGGAPSKMDLSSTAFELGYRKDQVVPLTMSIQNW